MKINWKLRAQNKTSLLALVAAILAFGYNALGLAGVVPGISQNEILEVVALGANVLVMLGIITDPTTPGVSDSARAQGYTMPGGATGDSTG